LLAGALARDRERERRQATPHTTTMMQIASDRAPGSGSGRHADVSAASWVV